MDLTAVTVEFTRVYLAVFFTGVAVFYTARIVTRKRIESRELVFPGACYSRTWWNHMLFRGFRLAIWMICLWRWPFPAVDAWLGPIAALWAWPVLVAGNILLTAGFGFALAVHFSLGRQWRSGIDPDGPGRLRTGGFYRYSRNPMFVGVAAAQAGFFLALPSLFSAACLLVGWVTLYRQTLAEEAHLRDRFGPDYTRYLGRVRRWI